MVAEKRCNKRRCRHGVAGIEDGVPWREEGLVHPPVRVGPSVEEEPSDEHGRQNRHRPVKSDTVRGAAQLPCPSCAPLHRTPPAASHTTPLPPPSPFASPSSPP